MDFLEHLATQLRRTQRVLAIAIVGVGALTGGNTVMSFVNSDDVAESKELNAAQNDEIKKLRADMAQLQIAIETSKRSDVDAGWSKLRPGMCGCLRKDDKK